MAKCLFSRRARHECGYTLVFAAIGLTLLLGGLGMAFDVGNMEYIQRQAQTAADAAAQAGAHEIQRGDSAGAVAAATAGASTNGFASGVNNVTVTINNPPLSGYYTGNSYAVEAIVSENVPTAFMRILGFSSGSIAARAVAAQVTSPNCVFALDPTMADAIQTSNGGTTNVGCGVIDDSSNSSALYATGSAKIDATAINVVGNYSVNNNGSFSPTPKTGVMPVADPLSGVPAPSVGSCTYTNYPNNNSGGQHFSLTQGVYCNGLNVTNGNTATFASGTYIISGGGVHFAGGTTVSGSNVTFYITKGNGYSFAPLIIDNGTNATFSAPTSGTYAGMLFFYDRSVTTANTSNSAVQLAGGANMSLTGALYFPGVNLNVSNGTNTTAAYTIIVADSITFTGGITLNANYSGLQSGSPIQVATLGE